MGLPIFLNKGLIVFLPTVMKTHVGLNALCVHPCYLSMCECEWRGRRERFLLRSVLPLGHPLAQHVGGSGLLVCHLMTGNPSYKATYFWSWKILMNLVSIWPFIPCQVLSHVPVIPKLGYSPPGLCCLARRSLNKPHDIWKDSSCLPPWLPMRFQHGVEEDGFTYT